MLIFYGFFINIVLFFILIFIFSLLICAAEHPLPSICRTDQISDWFEGLGNCLHWNERQKS
jgi:hypothetical protein